MISNALQFKFTQDQLQQRAINDYTNTILKVADLGLRQEGLDLEKTNSATDRAYKQALTSQVGTLDKPFIGDVTFRQFQSLPDDAKEYMLAKKGASILGDSKFMTSREWKSTQPDDRIKFLQGLSDNPKLKDIEMELRSAAARAAAEGSTKGEVTWTTATHEVTKRFGKLDPTGMWSVTPELQASHKLAQKVLVQLKKANADPLEAVNIAEDAANKYYTILNEASKEALKDENPLTRKQYIEEQTKRVNERFRQTFRFSPGD